MEVMIPAQNMDFDFNSARNSPYPSAPSTPRGFGECYYSAPPSPSRISEFYSEFEDFYDINIDIGRHGSPSEVAFEWEVKPGTPESSKAYTGNEGGHDFAFDVSEEVEGDSISAEELFDRGMIKPLKTPPAEARHGESSAQKSKTRPPRSSMSHGKRMIKGAFSPKHQTEHDPFTSDAQKTSKFTSERERGRERVPNLSSSSRRATRSLSPERVSQYPHEEEKELLQNQKPPSMGAKSSSSSSSSSASSKGQGKWRFKDLFLFRNASEGRASDKDLLRKYTATFKVIDSSAAGSNSRRRGPVVSAHEMLYTENRAAREELKKKTFLPYKGVWGRMPFNAALANGLGFSHK